MEQLRRFGTRSLTKVVTPVRLPQRAPPRLLTTAACGGLGSATGSPNSKGPPSLSYSYASPFGPAMLVTQGHARPKPGGIACWPLLGALPHLFIPPAVACYCNDDFQIIAS